MSSFDTCHIKPSEAEGLEVSRECTVFAILNGLILCLVIWNLYKNVILTGKIKEPLVIIFYTCAILVCLLRIISFSSYAFAQGNVLTKTNGNEVGNLTDSLASTLMINIGIF